MAYLGPPPSQKLATPTSQYFSGNGSATAFTLNRPVNVAEDLNVFVNNVAQQPGAGKSYTATGTTLTFDAAPDAGTNNVYVVYRGLSEGTLRLEQDPNSGITATTGTFTGDLTVDTTTLKVDSTNNRVGIGTASPASTLTVAHVSGADGRGIRLVNSSNNQTYETRIGTEGIENTSYSIRDMTADVVRFSIDSSGRVTTPSQPMFSISGANFNNNSGTATIVFHGSSGTAQDVNVGNHFSYANGRFTAPIAGKYQFTYTMSTGDTSSHFIQISKNGGSVQTVLLYGLIYNSGCHSTILSLAAGDYVTAERRGTGYAVYGVTFAGQLIG